MYIFTDKTFFFISFKNSLKTKSHIVSKELLRELKITTRRFML